MSNRHHFEKYRLKDGVTPEAILGSHFDERNVDEALELINNAVPSFLKVSSVTLKENFFYMDRMYFLSFPPSQAH